VQINQPGLRFLLEMQPCFLLRLGWQKGDGWLRFVLAAAIPLFFAALWGTFRVPTTRVPRRWQWRGCSPWLGDGFFNLAALALADARLTTLSWVFAGWQPYIHLVSYDRILWLVRQ
jgi:hypothetical protein